MGDQCVGDGENAGILKVIPDTGAAIGENSMYSRIAGTKRSRNVWQDDRIQLAVQQKCFDICALEIEFYVCRNAITRAFWLGRDPLHFGMMNAVPFMEDSRVHKPTVMRYC
jgi:hypothetical protein